MGNDELQPLGALERKIAAEHAFTRVPVASPSASIEQVRRSLGEGAYDSLTHVAILVGTKLVGVLTIESLFSVPGESAVRQVMDPDPPVVGPGTDQEVAARRAVEHGESALAVVDEEGDFVGFISPHRILAVLL